MLQKKVFTASSFSFLALALLFQLSCSTANPTASTPSKTSKSEPPPALPKRETASIAPAIERDILHYVNKHRESKGLAPLTFHAVLASEARNHSQDMAMKIVPFGHEGVEARNKAIMSKIKTVTAVSENVAHGRLTAQQAVSIWLKSAGHRRNIEGKYKYTGIGVARDQKSELYITQIFAN